MKWKVCVYEKDGMVLEEVIGTGLGFTEAVQVQVGVNINISGEFICEVEEDK